MNPDSPRFAMVAGEASGDLLAGSLLASLRQRWPDLVAEGIGGPRMAEQGFVAWWPHHKLSVHGYAEVLGHLREIFAIRSRLVERLLADKPDAFVGIDAPDFNLGSSAGSRPRGSRRSTSSAPRSGPGAAAGSSRSAAPPTWCCASSRSSRRSTPSAGSTPSTSATRSPARFRSRCRAPKAAPRSASAATRRWSRCCREAGAPRSATSRRACSAPRPR